MKEYIKNLGKVRPTSNGNWDKNKEYDILSIVKNKQTENVYISKKYVPANIEITNIEYWDNIIDNSLDIHFYNYVNFENLTLESTIDDIHFALHTINGEFRFPKAGDILIDLENDINGVFLYTENPAALDERPAKVTYFIYSTNEFDVPVKNIIFSGNDYENNIHIVQIDIHSFNDLKNKIDKNTNNIITNTNNINKLNIENKKHKIILNLTKEVFNNNNTINWNLNVTFDELKEAIANNSIIQIQWDNKIVTKSIYNSNNNEICLKFDNIYIETDNLFYNSIELKLTKGSSANKINIKKDFTNVKGNNFVFYDKNEIRLSLNAEEFSNFIRYNNIIIKVDDPLNEGYFMYVTLNNTNIVIADENTVAVTSHIYFGNYFGEIISDVDHSTLSIIMIGFTKLENNNWKIVIAGIEDEIRDFIPNNKLGKANGVASLNESGKVPSNQLPSYVDDVIYVERIIDRFESSGRVDNLYYAYIGEDKPKGIYNGYINNSTLIESFYTDKIYVLNQTSTISNITYNANSSIRWNGTKLIEIGSAHLTVGEIKGTAFDGKRGKDNEDTLNSHINNKTNPHKVTKVQIGLNNVTNDAQVKRSEMDVANGVAVLNANGKLKDENLDIINVPNIENHYGILVKKNMATSDSISVVEASEIYKQFQSISPKSNNCIIKAGSASNVNGTVQYSISAENNPKFSEVLDAYNRGANIILDTFVDALEVDRHRINITNWTYNNSNTLNGVKFACEDFNNQKIDVTIIKSGDNIQGNFKILNNFASISAPGLMSINNYTDIIDCKDAITNIKIPLAVDINYINNNFVIVNDNKEFGEKFKNAIINKNPIEFHISNFYSNVDEEIIIVKAISTNKIIDNNIEGSIFPILHYSTYGIFNDYNNNTIKLNIIYDANIFKFTINAYVDKFNFSIKKDEKGKPIVTGVPNILDIVEIEYDSKLIKLINDKTIIYGKDLNVLKEHFNFPNLENEIMFTTFDKEHNGFNYSFLNKLFNFGITKENNIANFSITNGGIFEDLIKDITKLKQIDSGDGEIIVTGGVSPFISEMTNDGFNINCRYSSPILEAAGEENITIPIAGNTTPGLLPKGYKNKIDVTALKVNTLDNFGLVGRILVKADGEGFIDKNSTVYLITGNNDISGFDTLTSSRENARLEIPKTTIQISNIGIEYVSTNGNTGFTVTTSKEVDKFIININKVELQNNQPIIINLYNL